LKTYRLVFLTLCAGLAIAGCSSGDNGGGPTTSRAHDAVSTAPAPSSAPSAPCRVDLAAPVIRAAVATLPVEPITKAPWSTDPAGFAGNFDPCGTLSTVIITVEGATGSSPNQALLFHKGSYVGTATADSHGFTSLDSGRTTDDTIGLTYKTPGSCNACPDGTFTHVQFHWDGEQVQMIGTPPK
jgi:hypothetical protein